MNTHVLFSKTEYLNSDQSFRDFYELAPKDRKAKIDRFKFQKDKKLSLGAWNLLRDTVALTGKEFVDAEIALGEHQKPDFTSDFGLHFNLSHSEDAVMSIVSEAICGCDIEKIDEKNLSLCKRFFLPSEAEFIYGTKNPGEQITRFTRIWVLKEAFMKCTGLGFSLAPNSFEFVLPDSFDFAQSVGATKDSQSSSEIIIHQTVSDAIFRFTEYAPFPCYRAATCIEVPKS